MAIVGAGLVMRIVIADRASIGLSDVASIIVKSLPWSFFTASIRNATDCLVGNNNLVAKMAFPKEVFPIAAVIFAIIDFLIASTGGVIALVFVLPELHATIVYAPLLLLLLIVLILGFALILSSLNLFYRDVSYVVTLVLNFAIFFTPVFYDVSMLGPYEVIANLNPVAPILEGLQAVVVLGELPDPLWTLYSAIWAVSSLVLGYKIFKALEIQFAERV
jgi:ABC-type polysaccharide/polyol phosphate export permease